MKVFTYRDTTIACFIAYIVQAMVINYVPLLFVRFQTEFSIGFVELTALVTLNFLVQLLADALSIPIVKAIGYRWVGILAHFLAFIGFIAMALLPNLMAVPYLGLVIATVLYSFGGGLIEVVINPIIEEIPSDDNEKMMSLMHSFYSWGFVGVTIIAMTYFYYICIEHWRWLTLIWCLVPLFNLILFILVPIPTIIEASDEATGIVKMLTNRTFWIFAMMMFCAGASEMALSQWLSLYMEETVGLSKALGDFAGPLSFAMMMGVFRTFFGLGKHNLSIIRFILICLVGLILGIIFMTLFENPWMSLLGSAIYGGSVGILWPGTYSLAGRGMINSPVMFGLLALIGDLGCSVGPALIGHVTSLAGGNLRIGISASIIFPIIFLWMLFLAKNGDAFSKKNL